MKNCNLFVADDYQISRILTGKKEDKCFNKGGDWVMFVCFQDSMKLPWTH